MRACNSCLLKFLARAVPVSNLIPRIAFDESNSERRSTSALVISPRVKSKLSKTFDIVLQKSLDDVALKIEANFPDSLIAEHYVHRLLHDFELLGRRVSQLCIEFINVSKKLRNGHFVWSFLLDEIVDRFAVAPPDTDVVAFGVSIENLSSPPLQKFDGLFR